MTEKRRDVSTGLSSDYASLSAGGISAYYGYEFGRTPEDEDGESGEVWGFRLTADGAVLMSMAFDQMSTKRDCPDSFECAECLLFGIGLALASGALTANRQGQTS